MVHIIGKVLKKRSLGVIILKMFKKSSSKALFSILLVSGISGSALAAPSITSHQAIYELDLKSATAASDVKTIDGKTHYTLKQVCDGWTSSENYAISFGFEEGGSANFISHYKTWESEDGSSFTYDIVENSDAMGEKAFQGFANSTGDSAEAFHSDGDGGMRALPENTVFPIHHMMALLDAAQTSSPVIRQSHMFFGGEIDDSLYFISAIMGEKKDEAPSKSLAKRLGEFAEDSYWPLSISYYNPDAQEAEPEYAITFQLQNNGVIRGYTVDYGEFRMRAKLNKIADVDAISCD